MLEKNKKKCKKIDNNIGNLWQENWKKVTKTSEKGDKLFFQKVTKTSTKKVLIWNVHPEKPNQSLHGGG